MRLLPRVLCVVFMTSLIAGLIVGTELSEHTFTPASSGEVTIKKYQGPPFISPVAYGAIETANGAQATEALNLIAYDHAWDVKLGADYVSAVQAAHARDAYLASLSRQRTTRSSGGGGGVPNAGGDCYARAPDGFPHGVIDRESGGDPNAHNPSGAHGCAQIMPEHFNGGACTGMSYDQCWERLWDNGRGASNWSQTL